MKRMSFVVAVLAACGGSDSNGSAPDASTTSGDGGGAGTDGGAPMPAVPATHFADVAENYSIPASGLSDGFSQWEAFETNRYWTLTDLDGDHFLDIVHTGDTAFSNRVWDATGSPYWKVYAGGTGAWALTAQSYAVPMLTTPGFYAAGITGGPEWRTTDINGDGRLDLVHTADPATGYVWDASGSPHWKVYLGKASGFEASAIAWTVPTSGTSSGFYKLSSRTTSPYWTVTDITRDGKPDLVQTSDPATGRVWDSASSPHWKVYANTGTGFETQATLWTVPPSGTTNGFLFTTSSSGTYAQWTTVDLDDDGRLDLVQTSDTATGTVWDPNGSPYWKLFRGTSSGFETTPTTWRVPPSGLSDGFFTAQSDAQYRYWSLVDIDGDGDRDLVQTGDTSFGQRVWDAAGSPYWKVYANEGAGFSLTLYRWNVPKGPTDGFYDTDVEWSYSNWFLADVNADGYHDLVHTANPSTGSAWDATGSAYWKVFRGQP